MINTTAPKVALVTGAARRIGAAIVRELHAQGWNVLIHARRSLAEASALADELNALRADSAQGVQGDLQQPEQIEALARLAHARWQRLDALVNNASSYSATAPGQVTPAQLDDLLGSNLRAPLLLTQACARLMREGAVVNLIDARARHAQPGFAPYAAAKAGLWSLTETLALELAPRIRVNGVAPGHMIWPESVALSEGERAQMLAQIPLARLGSAPDIARAVRFLLSDDAAYISGAVLRVDGGLGLV